MTWNLGKMPVSRWYAAVACLSALAAGCSAGTDGTGPARPNIIYILADDLGYGELGVYGQEKIETPNLDALAARGMRFTQHYTGAPVCAPARYMLLTGRHAGHAYIRGNDEWRERGAVWDYRAAVRDASLEGQRPIPAETLLFPRWLQEAGYVTGMIGKWGLGAPHTDAIPTRMGFDYFFGYNCQRQAHTYYPVHLYENEDRVYLANDTVPPNTRLAEGADPADERSYAPFRQADYAPDRMFGKLMDFVAANRDEPFFLYWATPIPHNAIQAPQRWVDHYRRKFGDEPPYLGEQGYFPHPSPRAGYAAMISYLDENVGKLMAYLDSTGLSENTLLLFSSDNGVTFSGGTDGPFFDSSGPFGEEYGRGKGFVYEGGIRVPLIAAWPGRIPAGSVTDHCSAHYDLVPTLAELLGLAWPAGTDGISFLPTLRGRPADQAEHPFLYWEFPEYGGQVAIRMGDWKLVRQQLNKPDGTPTLELYNLAADPQEQHNVAAEHPDVVRAAAAVFAREHTDSEVERFRIPLLENGLLAGTGLR
ncbi:MAG: hypothetical protein RLY31_1125 [Bacteroidota bacterium]|jgi:arylsulfatase